MTHPPSSPRDSRPALLPHLQCFTNCQLCLHGELIPQDLYFSPETGLITPNYYYRSEGVERIDLGGAIVAPGFLDLQTNGMAGFHFTQLGGGREGKGRGKKEEEEEEDERALERVARREVECGVTGWWATVPTVEKGRWREILPLLTPRPFRHAAHLLGAHAEGPYLHPSKKGAHNSSYFLQPSSPDPTHTPQHIFNLPTNNATLKLLTLAPELPSTTSLIHTLLTHHPTLAISLGHSTATYATGLSALQAGAKALTHTFNAMAPLHHREPGLAGLMGQPEPHRPYFSVIADGIHLHPSVLRTAFRADPARCIVITDSVELAGLPDGVYPGNGQVRHRQRKVGGRVTLVRDHDPHPTGSLAGSEAAAAPAPVPADPSPEPSTEPSTESEDEVLIGSSTTLDSCIANMVHLAHCTLAEAVRCATENVAALMGEHARGVLEPGRRADFVILHPAKDAAEGAVRVRVRETWVGGVRVYVRGEGE